MAQLLLQQGRVDDALKYFERAAELSRTEGEIVNALSYAEATRTQLEVRFTHSLYYESKLTSCHRFKKSIHNSRASSTAAVWVPDLHDNSQVTCVSR